MAKVIAVMKADVVTEAAVVAAAPTGRYTETTMATDWRELRSADS